MPDIVEHDNRAFVVFVPANGGDKTVESCIRLGMGPAGSAQATADENQTYNDTVALLHTMTGLSYETYHPTNGIAMMTPGAINVVGGQFNVTSSGTTQSTNGDVYNITQNPSGDIVTATYSGENLGTWATLSFNESTTVSVSTVPMQANFDVAIASYSLAGPIVLQNNLGVVWNSTIGFAVNATIARTTAIGSHTIVTTDLDGSNNAYYTKSQGSTAGEQFQWTVPLPKAFSTYDALQAKYALAVGISTAVIDAAAIAYALIGTGLANNNSPSAVQTWLKGSEILAICCTALNGILAAIGIGLGKWVDDQTGDESPSNTDATTFTLASGRVDLKTKTPKAGPLSAPAISLDVKSNQILLTTDNETTGTMLRLDGQNGITITLGTTAPGPEIVMTKSSLLLSFGKSVTATLDQNGILLSAGPHSIKVASDGIKMGGQTTTIDTTTTTISSLQSQFAAVQQGVTAANQAATQAAQSASEADKAAAAAKGSAAAAAAAAAKPK